MVTQRTISNARWRLANPDLYRAQRDRENARRAERERRGPRPRRDEAPDVPMDHPILTEARRIAGKRPLLLDEIPDWEDRVAAVALCIVERRMHRTARTPRKALALEIGFQRSWAEIWTLTSYMTGDSRGSEAT